ncbi:TPA: integrase arm-type DNA-binding domain-containing protein, partial [Escherichia coli]|nr:integrase arm-type DNA-binding domain-containing protein [Escherichia coli]
MARTTRPLTNTEVLRAKAIDKDLTLHDGDGLFLLVKTSGKKLWRFRYLRPATKQRTMMGLGAFPSLSLADARSLRADYLALLANKIDPQIQAEAAEEEQQIALESIFSTVA